RCARSASFAASSAMPTCPVVISRYEEYLAIARGAGPQRGQPCQCKPVLGYRGVVRASVMRPSKKTCRIGCAATGWSTQDYDLYSGDFNADGRGDILYVAKDPDNASGIALSDATGGPNTPGQS